MTGIKKLSEFLNSHMFKRDEHNTDYIIFKSNSILIALTDNDLEKVGYLLIGKNIDNLYSIDHYVLNNFFHYNKNILLYPISENANNLIDFLETKGKHLLEEGNTLIDKLDNFCRERDIKYNRELNNHLIMRKFNKAWDDQNFEEVINSYKQIDKDNLSDSITSKYNYALNKIKK